MPQTFKRFSQSLYLALVTALLATLLAGCMSKELRVSGSSTIKSTQIGAIVGHWKVDGSTAEFQITRDKEDIQIVGEDQTDGEKFVVSNIHWDGFTLVADFLMPSTKGGTHSELTLVDQDTLAGKYADGAPEIWRRAE